MMMVIVSYDVKTSDPKGAKRLRHVAKICQNYGERVQNSVFECLVDTAKLEVMKEQLLDQIDQKQDSLYFFNVGRKYHHKIESFGCKNVIDLEAPVIF